MADTRQISEEETTLDQLNEKSALTNSDLFLTRDNANQDYKVEFETVKNTLIGGAVAADNDKAPTGSTVNSAINGALANYDTKGNQSVIAKTDANLCIPNEQTESINYIAYGSNKNLPTNDASYFIRTQRSTSYIVQFASNVQNALTKTEPDYTRKAKLSGETWTFSPWEKLTTESDLNNALNGYVKDLKINLGDYNTRYCYIGFADLTDYWDNGENVQTTGFNGFFYGVRESTGGLTAYNSEVAGLVNGLQTGTQKTLYNHNHLNPLTVCIFRTNNRVYIGVKVYSIRHVCHFNGEILKGLNSPVVIDATTTEVTELLTS